MNYLYLHGFASGPKSIKAVYLRDRLLTQGIDLQVPDLNQGDFLNLTLTRQIQQCESILDERVGPWTIIGSSFGGLTAAWLGERNLGVQRLVLLAPAFHFLEHWGAQLGPEQLQQWQQTGTIEVFHHGAGRSLPLAYRFWQDATQYDEDHLRRSLPTLILHGQADEVIPVTASRRYASTRDWCELVELESDHGLGNCLPELYQSLSIH